MTIGKKNISKFGKTFEYLNDPTLRSNEIGDKTLTIQDADISGQQFHGQHWKNIVFENCDFSGSYEIKLSGLENVLFKNCNLSGIIGWGIMQKVGFHKATIRGKSYILGNSDSREVTFNECDLRGPNGEPNNQGAVGSYGESSFINCKAQWIQLVGYDKLSVQTSALSDVELATRNSGKGSVVLVEHCKISGLLDLVSTALQSLTIRDCTFNTIDVSNATVKGDILIEKVGGGSLLASVREVRNFTIRDSKFVPNGGGAGKFSIGSPNAQNVLLENVTAVGAAEVKDIGFGAIGSEAENAPPKVVASIALRRCTFDRFSASYSNTADFNLENCQLEQADFSNSRFGKMTFKSTRVRQTIDFTNTQAKEQDLSGLSGYASGAIKLSGSNVKLP